MIQAVADASQIAEARRLATALSGALGFDQVGREKVAIVASELGWNLLKHGGGGRLIIAEFDDADGRGLELLAIDQGVGMADVARCLEDGFSTGGSLGMGLGAVSRQSSRFAVYSRPGQGTAVMARFVKAQPAERGMATEVGSVVAPYPGESECGDRSVLDRSSDRVIVGRARDAIENHG